MRLERYGNGIARGMAVTFKHLFRKPITTQYPEEKLTVSKRIRGNILAWSADKCIGCHTCSDSCPNDSIAIITSAKGKIGIIPAPCSQACPSHVDASRYIGFIGQGKPSEALAVVREKIPFPSVCAYICAHPCESSCSRGIIDEPIAIRMLKRFAVDNDNGLWKQQSECVASSQKKVAVIGAGPAGLSAAYYLAKRCGHKVTVFEALPEAGGMLRYGIPDYRLPKNILRADIKEISDAGVEIITKINIDSPESLMQQGFDAVFVAIGAHQAIDLGVPGDDSPGVLGGIDFLREVNLGNKVKLGGQVAVIGGGNTAMDSARTALRLGSKEVSVIYRRSRYEMPASAEEIEDAIDEGIKFVFLAAPSSVTCNENGLLLECIRMKLGPTDASGRRRPEPVEGSQFTVPLDNIIAATSQMPLIGDSFGLETGKNNRVAVNSDTLATVSEYIFAGGDAVSGPATAIEAIAHGRQAAISIDKYLGGSGNINEVLAPAVEIAERSGKLAEGYRPPTCTIEHKRRINSFDGVEIGWDKESAVQESNRCLRCDLSYEVKEYRLNGGACIYCGLCVESCPFDALYMGYGYERATYRFEGQKLEKEDLLTPEKVKPSGYYRPDIAAELPQQSLLIDKE
ncbi:FAD-dependent oxidoreductase [Chloroflexota bacterium]